MATFFEYYELLKSILVPHFFYLFSLSIIKYFVKNEIAIRVLESFHRICYWVLLWYTVIYFVVILFIIALK
jgi:hypothetical protein